MKQRVKGEAELVQRQALLALELSQMDESREQLLIIRETINAV
jgi:hypothetical protein